MQFLKVGHTTDTDKGTGVTVFIFDKPAKGAYHLCGSSPASHELTTLALDSNVTHIDALTFLGGSAFGLSAVQGVMQWIQEKERGRPMPHGLVPLVPAVSIYDLAIKKPIPPSASDAYQACLNAVEDNYLQGSIGAGTGATIGKLVPHAKRMSGGLGFSELKLQNGLTVLAYAVVNSLGDIRDASGKIIAGASLSNGEFANCEAYLLSGKEFSSPGQSNTTLVAVFTNARFSKIELKRIAKVAIAGMARAIYPVFTCYDGDVLFCISLGEEQGSEEVVSTMAAEAVRQSILNAVKSNRQK